MWKDLAVVVKILKLIVLDITQLPKWMAAKERYWLEACR